MDEVEDRLTYAERAAALSIGGAASGLTAPRPLKLTIDDLVLLDRHWHDDDHKSTELIDGCIYFTPSRYMPRVGMVQELWARLREAAEGVAAHLFVGMRGSIQVSPYDLPLPDIVLTSEANGQGFILSGSVPLVVEVADANLAFYMGEKMRLYARAGISEYWTVDVKGQIIHQMWLPDKTGYHERREVSFGHLLVSTAVPRLVIATNDL
jgi:Uma2 family endonuclease